MRLTGKLPVIVLWLAAFPARGPAADGRASVVLISVDTLRAPVPMTLPAHTSLMTREP